MSDEQRSGGAPTDEERARAIREQLKSLHAFDLAYDMMEGLVTFGYQKMGLTDATSELRDLGDARLTIELLRATLGVVERELGEDHTLALHSTLAQMQLAYAQAVHLAGNAPGARPQAAEEPAAEEPAAEEPAAEEAAAEEPAAEEAVAEEAAAAEKPAAAKAAPRKPAAKKPAAKKPAAKKPAPKKAAPKKPTARKPRGGATPTAD
ncbi:MAG: hypothetical protein NTW58_12045 [Actinobacteria bacterium]|nr:hypothetical protein [Actinomycetota bacterium]